MWAELLPRTGRPERRASCPLFIYLQADLWPSKTLKLRVFLHLVLPSFPPRASFFFLISSLRSSSPLILFLNPLKPFSSLRLEESWRTNTSFKYRRSKEAQNHRFRIRTNLSIWFLQRFPGSCQLS